MDSSNDESSRSPRGVKSLTVSSRVRPLPLPEPADPCELRRDDTPALANEIPLRLEDAATLTSNDPPLGRRDTAGVVRRELLREERALFIPSMGSSDLDISRPVVSSDARVVLLRGFNADAMYASGGSHSSSLGCTPTW